MKRGSRPVKFARNQMQIDFPDTPENGPFRPFRLNPEEAQLEGNGGAPIVGNHGRLEACFCTC